ncbi:MAG: hypothetical protein ACFFC7_03535 [Candidatus Hermodarchaeota archaeon]
MTRIAYTSGLLILFSVLIPLSLLAFVPMVDHETLDTLALSKAVQTNNDQVSQTFDSIFFLLMFFGGPTAAIVMFPFSLSLLFLSRRERFPEAIQLDLNIPRETEDILQLSPRTSQKGTILFSACILLSPFIPIIFGALGSLRYGSLISLGASTGLLILSVSYFIRVKAPNLLEKNTLIALLASISGFIISLFLMSGADFNYTIVNPEYSWLESLMNIAIFLLGMSGSFLLLPSTYQKISELDKKKQVLRIESRTSFWHQIIEIPCKHLEKLVLHPGIGAHRNIVSILEFHLTSGKKLAIAGSGVFSTDLRNPHTLGTMFLKEGLVREVQDKLPVWPIKKKTLTSNESRENVLKQIIPSERSQTYKKTIEDKWQIIYDPDSTILEARNKGNLITPKGFLISMIPFSVIGLFGIGIFGLFLFFLRYVQLPEEILGLIALLLFASLGILLMGVAVWQGRLLLSLFFLRFSIIIHEDRFELFTIPAIGNTPGQYYYNQIEKIEPGKKKLGRYPVMFSNYFMERILIFCETFEEAEAIAGFIVIEVQRMAQKQHKNNIQKS